MYYKLFVNKLMKKWLYLLIPFVLMIMVNEIVRFKNNNHYTSHGFTILNPTAPIKDKCTWNCHNNTAYCIKHHIKVIKPFIKFTNTIYFGEINALRSTGNYGLANILLFVIILPIWIYYFIVKSIALMTTIKRKTNGINH